MGENNFNKYFIYSNIFKIILQYVIDIKTVEIFCNFFGIKPLSPESNLPATLHGHNSHMRPYRQCNSRAQVFDIAPPDPLLPEAMMARLELEGVLIINSSIKRC